MQKNPVTALFQKQNKLLSSLARELKLKSIATWNVSGIPEKHVISTSKYLGLTVAEISHLVAGTLNKPKLKAVKQPSKKTTKKTTKKVARKASKPAAKKVTKKKVVKKSKPAAKRPIKKPVRKAPKKQIKKAASKASSKPSKTMLMRRANREIMIARIKGLIDHPAILAGQLRAFEKDLEKQITKSIK